MLIRSQDKTNLVNVVRLEISTVFVFTKRKAIIYGYYSADTYFSMGKCQLATLNSKEEAINILDEVEKFFKSNPNGIYNIGTQFT